MYVTFKNRKGVSILGRIVRSYLAFEGGMKYIITADGIDYRCIKDEQGNYVELVV